MSTVNDPKPGEQLARVLLEEQAASDMAKSIAKVIASVDGPQLATELERFRTFLAGDLEVHFAKEEADLFPVLSRRGFEIEVAQATRQHGEIRRLGEQLQLADSLGDAARVRAFLGELARALTQHIQFEAELLYVDL